MKEKRNPFQKSQQDQEKNQCRSVPKIFSISGQRGEGGKKGKERVKQERQTGDGAAARGGLGLYKVQTKKGREEGRTQVLGKGRKKKKGRPTFYRLTYFEGPETEA